MTRAVVIDCFPDSAERYLDGWAIVAIDVIRATTTATTALGLGRRVFPARSTDEAEVVASRLTDPLLVGELGGNMPYGFHENNSPAAIARRTDIERPMVLVSSSGTQLIANAAAATVAYLACLRNYSAVARVVARHRRVAIIGAGTRGRFRREDQIGCARLAERLIAAGYAAQSKETVECVARWRDASLDVIREGKSAEYLRRSGQERDLEFVLAHIDDLDTVPRLVMGELVVVPSEHGAMRPADESIVAPVAAGQVES